MTKICLIHTPVSELKDDRLDPPMGLLYLATELKNTGWDVEVCDLSGNDNIVMHDIPFAHYYGFSTYTANYQQTINIKNWLEVVYPDSIMIAGGAHASALPNEVIKDFDYVVVGEGEIAIQEILEDKHEHKSIVKSDLIMDLDKLPYVDYSLVDLSSYHRFIQGERALPIFSSRGCPFRCAFCSSFNGYRKRSPQHFVWEIHNILDNYEDMRFRIKDDLFVKSVDWLQDFVDIVPQIKYDCLVRAGHDPKVPELLKESGCTLASLGIESGSNIVLKSMNKGATAKMNQEAIKGLKDVGIQTLAWMIVGFPGETWDTVKETVDFLNKSAPDIVTVYPLIPYPGTDVWNNPDKYGMRIIDKDFSHYFYIKGNYEAGYVYETDTLNPSIIQEMRQYMIDNIRNSDIR